MQVNILHLKMRKLDFAKESPKNKCIGLILIKILEIFS